MTQENYTDEERYLAFGAGRSCCLEIRQRARAIGDDDTADLIGIALHHLGKLRPPKPSRANDDTIVPFPRQINPVNALLALNRRGEI